MSLIEIIQKQILDDTCRVSTLLLSAKLIATKLNQKEILYWLQKEIDGYNYDELNDDNMPLYRFIPYRIEHLSSTQGWLRISEGRWRPHFIPYSLDRIQTILEQQGDITILPEGDRRKEISRKLGVGSQVRFLLERSDLAAIIVSVRDNILEWSMKLEAEGITGDGMNFPQDQIEKASQMVVTIHNSGNMNGLGFGNSNSISAHQRDVSTTNIDNSKVRDLVSHIKPIIDHVRLPPDALKDANNAISSLDEQLAQEAPEPSFVKSNLVLLRDALTHAGIPVIAKGVIETIQNMLT